MLLWSGTAGGPAGRPAGKGGGGAGARLAADADEQEQPGGKSGAFDLGGMMVKFIQLGAEGYRRRWTEVRNVRLSNPAIEANLTRVVCTHEPTFQTIL